MTGTSAGLLRRLGLGLGLIGLWLPITVLLAQVSEDNAAPDPTAAITTDPGDPAPSLAAQGQRLSGIDEQVKSFQATLDRQQAQLSELGARIDEGLARIDPLSVRLDGLVEELKRTDGQLEQHEARLEDNGVKLFETLMGIDGSREALNALQTQVTRLARRSSPVSNRTDDANATAEFSAPPGSRSWELLWITLGFPLGVLLLLSPALHQERMDRGLLLAWLGGGSAFVLLGGGLMFGASQSGLLGNPLAVWPELLHLSAAAPVTALVRDLGLHGSLAAGAALLFVGAACARLGTGAQLLAALIMGGLLYPLIGHWTLSGRSDGAAIGWLAGLGVAGAPPLALATLSGVAALALAWGSGSAHASRPQANRTHHEPLSGVAGALILWATWLALLLSTDTHPDGAPWLILASATAAVGAVSALILGALLRTDLRAWEQRLPGALLVGVLSVSLVYAQAHLLALLLLGGLAGVLYRLCTLLIWRRFGDGADLALVFAVGGSVSVLAPGFLGPEGVFAAGVFEPLMIQLLGLAVTLMLAMLAGGLLGRLLRGRFQSPAD